MSDPAASQAFSRLQAKVFRLAVRQKDRITLSETIVETGLSLSEVEKIMDGIVDGPASAWKSTKRA